MVMAKKIVFEIIAEDVYKRQVYVDDFFIFSNFKAETDILKVNYD